MGDTEDGILKIELNTKSRINKGFINLICNHKLISMILVVLLILSVLNGIMIYTFFNTIGKLLY